MYPQMSTIKQGIWYKVVEDYDPDDENKCISCRQNDIIFVKKPFCFQFMGTEELPSGWLYGTNQQTNRTGYVPADYVTFMQVEITSQVTSPTQSQPFPEPVKEEADAPLDQEWYWGDASRDNVKARLADQPDGSFLVRNSSNDPKEYTLSLCKGGSIKLIRICHQNGMYGFADVFRFSSVVQLVEHYRNETLEAFNPNLDVKLKYPVSPRSPGNSFENRTEAAGSGLSTISKTEQLWISLREADQAFVQASNKYEKVYSNYSQRQENIHGMKTAILGYEETIKIFNAQCSTLNGYIEETRGQRDESRLLENFRRMQTRLKRIVSQCRELKIQWRSDIAQNKALEHDLNALKSEMMRAKKLRDEKIIYMRSRKVSEEQINQNLQLDDNESRAGRHVPQILSAAQLRKRYPDHCCQQNWYFPHYNREKAAEALQGTEDGTFLIRNKTTPSAPYACSLVADGSIHHCLIEFSTEGYGFAEPFNVHATLDDLVLHYAENSLVPHNERLDTNLRVPVRCAKRVS